MSLRPMLLICLPLLLAGCGVAKAVITAPIKAGEVIYDGATESQEEADIKRGRAIRKEEERQERERRRAEKEHQRQAPAAGQPQ